MAAQTEPSFRADTILRDIRSDPFGDQKNPPAALQPGPDDVDLVNTYNVDSGAYAELVHYPGKA